MRTVPGLLAMIALAAACATDGDNGASAATARAGDNASDGPASAGDSAASPFLPPLPPPPDPGPAHFTFAGLAPPTTFDSLASRYPRSEVRNYFIYLDEAEAHDGITGIGFTGDAYGWRRLSISFEKFPGLQRPEPPSRRYPRCDRVLAPLQNRYGQADSAKQFADDQFARIDRYWNAPGEVMILLCILSRDVHYARALTLERFPR